MQFLIRDALYYIFTFFDSIGMLKQTINYFNVAVGRRGITFNQVKPISSVTNLQ